MTPTLDIKKCNYLKLIKLLYIEKTISLKQLKKLVIRFPLYQTHFPNPKKYDRYLKLYLEDKICIELLKELHIFDNSNALKN